MSTVPAVLSGRGLVKRFGKVVGLNGSDIDLFPGEVLAVIGDNGAGKSTLIKCFSGAHTPDTGTMNVTGQDVLFRSTHEARLAGIETVFQTLAVSPALDIAETDNEKEITAEIPGVKEDDLDISISNGVLTLKGEKSSDHEEKEQDYHLVERRYGSFRRQVPLGFAPEDGAVDAKFADGVLKLKIAKPAEAKKAVQKISISKG